MLYLCVVKCQIGLQQWALVFGIGNGLKGIIARMQDEVSIRVNDLQPILFSLGLNECG